MCMIGVVSPNNYKTRPIAGNVLVLLEEVS